jgi:hypothetical protein
MADNPYRAILRGMAPRIETALDRQLPQEGALQGHPHALHSLDPYAARLVLAIKMIALFPATLACGLLGMESPFSAPTPIPVHIVVLLLTAFTAIIIYAVHKMEDIVGRWRWVMAGEVQSASHLRFLGLQFFPAKLAIA